MTLCFLEEGVRTRLRSGVAITSMAQCVEELVENCIDAGGTCIAVRVDLSRYRIQVGIHMLLLVIFHGNMHCLINILAESCSLHITFIPL